MSPELLRSLIWLDYRLAVIFTVLIPLGLMIWSVIQNAQAITHLLTIYWRVASLLAITVYLMMAQIPVSFIASVSALVLIPISLWFWIDLNEEIADQQSALKLVFNAWRWAVSGYCAIALLAQLPFLGCAFGSPPISAPRCQAWLEAPYLFHQVFHGGTRVGTLGFLAMGALIIYVLCLLYFAFFKLSKQGRSATGL